MINDPVVSQEYIRPSVLFKPRIFMDGNKWCCLYGDNLQEGVAGFGDSPNEAARAFDKEWCKTKVEYKTITLVGGLFDQLKVRVPLNTSFIDRSDGAGKIYRYTEDDDNCATFSLYKVI